MMTNQQVTPNIIALIPAYNESRHILPVIQKASEYLPVLVVDDGSKDDTAAIAEGVGARVVRQTPNQGKGVALMTGFHTALELGCDAVVMLDADGQHDPDEIPKFLNAYQKNQSDLIIGKREFQYMPMVRRATNTFGTWVFSWVVGQPIPDNQSGFRLLSRRMMLVTLTSREASFEFEVEMIVRCIQKGYTLDWVPIRTIYGDEKSHINPWHHVVHFFRVMYQSYQAIHQKPPKA